MNIYDETHHLMFPAIPPYGVTNLFVPAFGIEKRFGPVVAGIGYYSSGHSYDSEAWTPELGLFEFKIVTKINYLSVYFRFSFKNKFENLLVYFAYSFICFFFN